MVHNLVDYTHQDDKDRKITAKNDTSDYHEHEDIKYGIYETDLYKLDKFSIDKSHKN